jgi:hypothetical protein
MTRNEMAYIYGIYGIATEAIKKNGPRLRRRLQLQEGL